MASFQLVVYEKVQFPQQEIGFVVRIIDSLD